ncbi:putative NOT transcription complex subunit VIP2 isoform X2 [Chlorella sorokiniana]|uniref:NOT transcription complex subunit VIP2 isoform X2 n=1 Tax=Chlorella sorokiniana TaxID=3076 RepID=A0A2P6TLJ3_CHLSO|nr:putative NOT transcription complex subunit VIP2 isoform X2 [Chlorella sorokiniana]|eukprot:PRW45154.1 putative NOT transcription complex subunit VIP2 isoform X2 [Chlorella sorokiniana]
MLGNTNAGLDSRFAQFQGQGQPGAAAGGGYPGLGGNMQALQSLQAGSFGLQNPLQAGGRPGLGGLQGGAGAGGALGAQQRLGAGGAGLGPSLQQLGLGQAGPGARVAMGPGSQQFAGVNGLAGARAGLGGGVAGLNPALQQQGLANRAAGAGGMAGLSAGGLGGYGANLAALQGRPGGAQGAVPGLAGLGGRLGGLSGLGAGGSGYGAPSGDLLSMLNKGGQQRHDGGAAQHGGGPQDGPAFDASDFPSLSAAAAQAGQHRSADGSSETFAALLGSQKGGGAGQQQQAGPSFGEEDFPALPGSSAQPAPRQQQQDGSEGAAQLQQLQQQLGSLAGEGGGGFGGAGLDALRLQQQRQLQAQAALKGVAPGAAAAAAAAGGKLGMAPPPDRFGLLGLLSVIRMTDPDLTTLALGTDLTTLGLNLNSPEALWKTFASPWADGPGKPEPDFKVPACYLHSPPRLQPGYFSKFQPDTLFYIFYGMPGDEAQLFAADELAARGWYYHKEYKAWLTRAPNTEPVQKTDRFERGSFFLFDPNSWEVVRKDNFVVHFEHLERAPALRAAAGAAAPPGGAPPAGTPPPPQSPAAAK